MSVHAGVTIGGILALGAKRFPDKTALVFDGDHTSYRRVDELSNRLSHSLIARGVKKGMKVALLARNCPEFVVSHFAVAKAGATLVPLNFLFVARELAYVIKDSDAEFLIFAVEFTELVDSLRGELDAIRAYVAAGNAVPAWALSYAELVRAGSADDPGIAVDEDDEYTLMYTSGTTGRPKGVVSTHRSRVLVAIQGVIDYHMDHDQITALALPLFHMGGLNTCFVSHMLSGATVVLLPRFDVLELLRVIEKERVTFLFLAPSPIYSLVESEQFGRFDLSSVRWCMYGGAPMPREILNKMSERLPKVRLIQGYGSTEAGQLSFLGPQDHERKAESAGRPNSLAQVRVVDENDCDVETGEVGEIVTRGPNVMKGYYKSPEATAEAFRNGWLHTGDLARLDEDGFLTIVDRKNDMIISGSENIYPKEIEEVLYAHPRVQDAAVFGIPDEKWGESVCAAIVLRPGATATQAEIIEYCKKHLASYKKPRVVMFVDSLPRTSIGKIAKAELREPYWRGKDRRI